MRRTALVTGGGRGIGRAICVRLAASGMNVAINYSGSVEAAEQTVALCRDAANKAGHTDADFLAVQANVSIAEDVEKMLGEIIKKLGHVEVLVNNAGITKDNLIMRMSLEDFDDVLSVNLRSAFLLCKLTSRQMLKARWGRIVNISSVVGLFGNAGQANYAASKAGLVGLTKSLAKELGARNVTCNAVAPGFIETDMTAKLASEHVDAMLGAVALGRPGSADDVAAAVAFLASEEAGYISGQVLAVDGCMAI